MHFAGQNYNIKIWNMEIGKLGRFVAVDTETTMVPFHMTPDIVTMQAYSGGSNVYYIQKQDISKFLELHSDSFLVFHNAPFDWDVVTKHLESSKAMYSFYDNCRVRDTGVLYRLWHLAHVGFIPFKYNLALLTKQFCGIELIKDETRENFSLFIDSKISDIPSNYLEYGAKDVIATYKLYFALIAKIREHDKQSTLLSHDIQVKGDLALNHIYKNGIGFDLARRDEWLKEIDKKMQEHADILASWGWVRGRKGIKDVYSRIIDFIGISNKIPRTESGELSSKAGDLQEFRDIPFINSYLEYHYLEKASSFVRDITSNRVHPRYNLLVNTGRTSCSKPNFQQLPRVGGIREMFVANSDNTLLITDYSAIELSTLAQVCYNKFGYSEMRNQINKGKDLHKYYASVMHGCDVEDVTKQWRQEAKAANFGFPGGLGIDTFIEFSKGYGLELTSDVAKEMKEAWFAAFPEMDSYMENEIGHVFTLTGRKRGNTSYCAEKNTPFQGLAADGAKLALYNLDKAGFKVVGFVHDEVITEVKRDRAKELLKQQEEIMVNSMLQVVPDVKISVESDISEFYTK